MTVQPPAERPAPGYYPDPSIPGFVRYWDGDAWTPGSARPAPQDGAPLPPPPRVGARGGVRVAPPPPPRPAAVEETGPVFLDETGAARLIVPPEPTPSVWSAQAQPGLLETGAVPQHVTWGVPGQDPAPVVPAAPAVAADPDDELASALRLALSQTRRAQLPPPAHYETAHWTTPAPRPETPTPAPDPSASQRAIGSVAPAPEGGTVPVADPAARAGVPELYAGASPAWASPPGDVQGPGERAGVPEMGPPLEWPPRRDAASALREDGAAQPPARPGPAGSDAYASQRVIGSEAPAPEGGAGPAARAGVPEMGPPLEWPPRRAAEPRQEPASHAAAPAAPAASAARAAEPVGERTGSGLRPRVAPVAGAAGEVSQAKKAQPAAERQGSARAGRAASGVGQRRPKAVRPALLGPRIGARLVDTLVTYAVVGVLGVVLVQRVTLHLQAKVDAARASGLPQTVWLVDGTVLADAGLLLAALLVVGVVYETIPVAVWGRTLGKAIFGLSVLDARTKARPRLGRTFLRTALCQTLVFLLLGILELVPCAADRKLRQSWHDRLGGTYVVKR